MAIDVVITQKGLFKKPLLEELLSPGNLRAGHWNHAGVLDPGPAPDGRTLCDPARPGRGCFLLGLPGEKEQVSLRQPLPCTRRDLEVFYGLIENICRFWKTDRFTQDGETCRLSDIPELIARQDRAGEGLLKAMAQRWKADGMGIVTGAVYPIYLEPGIIDRLAEGDTACFAQVLAERQAGDWYYAKPNFYRSQDGAGVLGVYTVTEEVPSILPAKPFVPPLYSVFLQDFGLDDGQVTDWRVSLVRVWEENGEMQGKGLGYLPFEKFARRVGLDRCPRYDAKHVLAEVKDMDALLRGGDVVSGADLWGTGSWLRC